MVASIRAGASDFYQELISIQTNKLQALLPINNVTFESDVWLFKKGRETFTADFNYFHQPYTHFFSNTHKVQNDRNKQVRVIDVAKIIVLSLIEDKAISANVTRVIECVTLLFSYLKFRQIDVLTAQDLDGMYAYLLSNNPAKSEVVSRHYPPAYASRLGPFDIQLILRTLQSFGFGDFLIPNLLIKHYLVALNTACIKVMGITLADYKKGGTFNSLGLNIGRHYIDFCAETFDENIAYATACRLTYENILEDVKTRIKYKTEYTIKRVCVETLMGVELDEIEDNFVLKMMPKPKKIVRQRTLALFCKYYNKISPELSCLKLDTINAIVQRLQLPKARFDNQEFVRVMLFTRYNKNKIKSRKKILLEFKSYLGKEAELKWGLEEFDAIADSVNNIKQQTPRSAFILCRKNYHLCSRIRSYRGDVTLAGSEKLRHALAAVEAAGTTLFVAMTGWRASEFGFPFNNIHAGLNLDALDSVYTPFRFHVNWVVPKTSSTTPLTREITLAGYILAKQMSLLNLAKSEEPCLYSLGPQTKYPSESKSSIDNRVEMLWQSFCEYYSMFVELDELELFQNKKNLDKKEEERFIDLSSRYDFQSSPTLRLKNVRDDLRSKLSRYTLAKDTHEFSFKNRLLAYKNQTLSPEHLKLFEDYLSNDTKNALKSELIELDPATVRSISSEFLEGVSYPTTHGLRHMWAEAVLLRYRGDVGKFIRANFKHLDEGFFMAYIRDKEAQVMGYVVERNVINSVVKSHLLTLTDKNREYAGGFDRYLERVVKLTKIQSYDDFVETAKKIADDRIISVKANAWATCMLRIGTESIAKCSEDGVPQRHNSSPKLCLGCTNADVSKGNFNGIVVYTRPEVEACRDPELPVFIKVHCIEILKPALAQVELLRKNSGNVKYDAFILYLKETINIAQKAIEKSNA